MHLSMAKMLCLIVFISSIVLEVHAYTHGCDDNADAYIFISDTQHDNNSTSCDHCCHGSSHSLGILHDVSLYFFFKDTYVLNTNSYNYTSRTPAPPYRPPAV